MTLAAILAALGTVKGILASVAAIAGVFYGVFKWVTIKTEKTEDQKQSEIQHSNLDEQHQSEDSGRPV